jgi:hypothetical protein
MHLDVDAFAIIELYIFADDELKPFREVTAHQYLALTKRHQHAYFQETHTGRQESL